MSGIERILVSYKRTTYERYADAEDPSLSELIESGDVSVAALRESHDVHHRSLETVLSHLESRGLSHDAVYRGDVEDVQNYDLVLSVGGDGTVLDLSHKITTQPLLAVNSDPRMSFGYFCAGTAEEFAALLDETLTGAWEPIELFRYGVALDGERVGSSILNDVLVAHENPAAVTSYVLRVGEAEPEPQKIVRNLDFDGGGLHGRDSLSRWLRAAARQQEDPVSRARALPTHGRSLPPREGHSQPKRPI